MNKILMLIGFFGSLAVCRADLSFYDANLDPFQEVPPHNTPGYGNADFSFDSTTGILTVTGGVNGGIYADLLAGATTVRLQDAAIGANGPTVALVTLNIPGNTSGTFGGASGVLTTQQITDLESGNFYINIADSVFPSGEIRGQLVAVPEPATYLAAILLLIPFGVTLQRNQRFSAILP
jgi:hypothetical protein